MFFYFYMASGPDYKKFNGKEKRRLTASLDHEHHGKEKIIETNETFVKFINQFSDSS